MKNKVVEINFSSDEIETLLEAMSGYVAGLREEYSDTELEEEIDLKMKLEDLVKAFTVSVH